MNTRKSLHRKLDMKIQDKATNVLQRAAHLLRAQRTSRDPVFEPTWFRVVANHPPTQNLARKPHNLEKFTDKTSKESAVQQEPRASSGHYITRQPPRFNGIYTNSRHLYRPKKITYFEDEIRKLFFEHHPWELARPKLLVETDGKDSTRTNWSTLDQLSKKLDGESVVQRTIYLLENEPKYAKSKSWLAAYDQARLEFYRLRIRQDTQAKIAAEEAVMYGAVFGKSFIEKGVEKEQAYIEKWKVEALEATKAKQARNASPSAAVVEEAPSTEDFTASSA